MTIIKNNKNITIGAITLPRISPNLIQAEFSGFNKLGFRKAKVKKINAGIKKKILFS